jgi:L-serine/L-threonine ammonia-lyase
MELTIRRYIADEHKMLVELACSTTLAPAYSEATFSKIMRAAGVISGDESMQGKTVVFVVCGGVKISSEEIDEYQSIVESVTSAAGYEWTVRCEGEEWKVPI